MLAGWVALVAALAYLFGLFAVAQFGDTRGRFLLEGRTRPIIYALTLAVYCTSWTFLGSVGLSSHKGYDFLPIYLGPLLGILIGLPLLARVIYIAKAQKITSIADFIGARYGKSETVAGIVAMIAVAGSVPYIALQLKAISSSLEIIVFREFGLVPSIAGLPSLGDASLFVTMALAAFAIAFGTRHIDATEHQNGLMLAIATESVVKLVAFLAVGIFVVFWLFDGFDDLFRQAALNPRAASMMAGTPDPALWLTTTGLAACAIFLLPRQFHVMVVENRDLRDLRHVAWQFPLYLVLINLFVIPIALAGLILLPGDNVDRDFMVLSLPLEAGSGGMALIAFIGALSAATAMVIVESVACGIMVSNDLAIPILLRRTKLRPREWSEDKAASEAARAGDPTMVETVLTIRRVAVIAILFLGFSYYRASEQVSLASIGLLSFAAIAQLMPAFLLGLFWPRANARGAIAGMLAGFFLWFYLLFLPTLAGSEGFLAHVMRDGPFGLAFLAPASVLDPQGSTLVQGVAISLTLNLGLLVLLSLLSEASPIERVQASLFTRPESSAPSPAFRIWRSSVSVEELRQTVARYLGAERTAAAFDDYAARAGAPLSTSEADAPMIRFAEHLLASAIGAASSRLVLSLMLRRRLVSTEAALKLLDDASAAIQYSRTLLQHGLDHARQGVTVFDRDLRLMCWNRAFLDLFDLPGDLVHFGIGLDEIVSHNARRGLYGKDATEDVIAQRIAALAEEREPQRLALWPSNIVIEIRSNHLPDGGLVTTYTDITAAVAAEKALEEANASLEKRVRQRTDELTQANRDLARAKLAADEANLSKTRFLAAASHDIAQPLNAAKLYAAALADAAAGTAQAELAGNVEASLLAVEEILSALLEMSRLDAGKMQIERSDFAISELLGQLQIEFGPIAAAKGVELVLVPSALRVMTDRRLLRRLLQNLISNAIKYTPKGKVLIGCRRLGGQVRLDVLDSGIGIPANKQKVIFKEFTRLDQGTRLESGLGLGLSIVERIVKVLDLQLSLHSVPGKGSRFSLVLARGSEKASKPSRAAPMVSAAGSLAGTMVVVIDNEATILDAMRRLLEGWQCETVLAGDAPSALVALDQLSRAPDLLLVDYHLDTGDGLGAIEALRARLGPLPAVLVTAERDPELRQEAAARGVHMLNKPVKPSALRALIGQLRLKQLEAAE